ncbi:hypothetical protein [Streptomyces sp. NPDC047123]|uniref:hypothetical protein n=1 Tax=Streptomyces sp. NPDC047123 TaxID=3155622 RepID=UPI0033F9B45A
MLPRLPARTIPYVLLLCTVFVCFGGHLHAHQGPPPSSAVLHAGAAGGAAPVLDAPAAPDHCHEPGSGSAVPSSARPLPALLAVAGQPDGGGAAVLRTRGPAPRAGPAGGRSALSSLCRWRL